MVKKEATGISDATIQKIIDNYDVDLKTLRYGWFFVGEVGCNYWFAILSPDTFDKHYKFTKEISPIGKYITDSRERISVE